MQNWMAVRPCSAMLSWMIDSVNYIKWETFTASWHVNMNSNQNFKKYLTKHSTPYLYMFQKTSWPNAQATRIQNEGRQTLILSCISSLPAAIQVTKTGMTVQIITESYCVEFKAFIENTQYECRTGNASKSPLNEHYNYLSWSIVAMFMPLKFTTNHDSAGYDTCQGNITFSSIFCCHCDLEIQPPNMASLSPYKIWNGSIKQCL